jgi:hypothetical protein
MARTAAPSPTTQISDTNLYACLCYRSDLERLWGMSAGMNWIRSAKHCGLPLHSTELGCQAFFALGRNKSVTPRAAIQSPQLVLPMRLARSNTGESGRAVARMSR